MQFDHDWNERKAIHFRMQQLRDEQEEIRKEFVKLFDRLRELDSLQGFNPLESRQDETEGQSLLATMYEGNELASTLEVNDSKDVIGDQAQTEMDIFSQIGDIIKNIQVSSSPNQTSSNENIEMVKSTQQTKGQRKPQSADELINHPPSPENKYQYRDYIIVSNLKERQILKTSDVTEILNEHDLGGYATILLNRLVKLYPEVTKKSHGLYKWENV